jgi:hypothetical protein
MPFDKLTVLSKVEGLTALSRVEGLRYIWIFFCRPIPTFYEIIIFISNEGDRAF